MGAERGFWWVWLGFDLGLIWVGFGFDLDLGWEVKAYWSGSFPFLRGVRLRESEGCVVCFVRAGRSLYLFGEGKMGADVVSHKVRFPRIMVSLRERGMGPVVGCDWLTGLI